MAKLDLDDLKNNANARVLVAIPGTRGVRGIIQGNLQISGSNEFQSAFEASGLGDASRKLQIASALLGDLKPDIIPSTLLTLQGSVYTWSGSGRPTFTVPMTFLAVRETDDVRRQVADLYRTVFPTTREVGEGKFLEPPLGYNPIPSLTTTGTIAVSIGNWFTATQQVMRNVDFTFSKEVIASGSPLYATGSIAFEPFRAIQLNDMKGYLKI